MTPSDGKKIDPNVARWAQPLLVPRRYKGAKGGRSGGKSHQFCELAAAAMAAEPTFKVAGIREIQKSIKHSLKSLLEQKIHNLGASYLFDFQGQEIKRIGDDGVAIFLGMQDHTADAVKGLEGFDLALVDEANALSHTSLTKLTPTFRKQSSEIWFAWNPDKETDAVDEFFEANQGHEDFALVHVNITDNPWASDTAWAEYARERDRAIRLKDTDPNVWAQFLHVWEGEYDTRSDRYVFRNWRVGECEVPDNIVWFYGVDWGFAVDPTAGVKLCFPDDKTLYIRNEVGRAGVPTEALPQFLLTGLPGIDEWPSIADSARPETIDYVRRHGVKKMRPAKKGKGSIQDGINFLQGFDIVIHPDCTETRREFRGLSYKIDRGTGEVLPVIEDKDNHFVDSTRYAVEGQHRKGKAINRVLETPQRRQRYDDPEEDSSWKTI